MAQEKEKCPTCGHPLNEYTFTFSVLDAELLLAMARDVRRRTEEGAAFTRANKVHLPTLSVPYNVGARKTISSKLGLIAMYRVQGKQERGMWVITARGWAALRGDAVPSRVSVKEGAITERFGETTTLTAALRTFPTSQYNPAEWFEFGRVIEHSLL